jgi:hypothetical protein
MLRSLIVFSIALVLILFSLNVKGDEQIKLKAYSEGNGVWLEWQTNNEVGIAGFRIYRSQKGRKAELVTPVTIPGTNLIAGEDPELGRAYNYFDPKGDLTCSYFIEIVYMDGNTSRTNAYKTKRVKSLKEIAGVSVEELLKRTSVDSNPIIQKENLEIPADLENDFRALDQAIGSDSQTQKWIAAQPGVKIGVKQDGIYRVSRSALQSAGFDVNAPVERWQLYTDGVEQAINVGPNGDYIEFYGRGIDINETDTRIYYLVVGNQNGKRMNPKILRMLNGRVIANSFQQTITKKDNIFYLNQVLNGSRFNFFGALVSTSGGTTTINIPSIDTSVPTVNIEINVQGYTLTQHNISVLLNNTQIGTIQGSYRSLMTQSFVVPTSLLVEGSNTIKLISNISNSTSFTDEIKVSYSRKYEAVQNKLFFYTPNYRVTKVRGFSSSDIKLYDVSDPDNPKFIANPMIETEGSSYNLVLPSSRGSIYYATTTDSIQTPSFVIANVPSNLSSPQNQGRIIIISHSNWMQEAENWANFRRSQGFSVKVVNVEDIFDEFDYGLPTSEAIKNFLEFAKNNWQVPPDYVLLLGDSTYDPRNFFGYGYLNFIPTMMVDTVYMETGSDEALADFDYNGLAEISIGRIPARNSETVSNALAKTIAFEQGIATAYSRGGLFPSDLPNGYDFEGMNNRLIAELPSSIPTTTVNRSASDARDRVINGFNNGPYIVNYSGHGTFAAWAGSLFSRNDVPSLTNTNSNLMIANMLTCLNGYFIEPSGESLSEALVNKAQGGAVASWASTGLTTPDVQEIMAQEFYRRLRIDSANRIGDLIKQAKTAIPYGRDVRLSWALLGDPALKIKPDSFANSEQETKTKRSWWLSYFQK